MSLSYPIFTFTHSSVPLTRMQTLLLNIAYSSWRALHTILPSGNYMFSFLQRIVCSSDKTFYFLLPLYLPSWHYIIVFSVFIFSILLLIAFPFFKVFYFFPFSASWHVFLHDIACSSSTSQHIFFHGIACFSSTLLHFIFHCITCSPSSASCHFFFHVIAHSPSASCHFFFYGIACSPSASCHFFHGIACSPSASWHFFFHGITFPSSTSLHFFCFGIAR